MMLFIYLILCKDKFYNNPRFHFPRTHCSNCDLLARALQWQVGRSEQNQTFYEFIKSENHKIGIHLNMITKNSFQAKAKINKSTEIYKGKLFSFVAEDITLPNGVRSKIAMVRHPGSTAIVPMIDDHTVVMIRQYRHPIREYILEIPSGTLEPGESSLNCAKRELEEETGLTAGAFIELAQVYILPAYTDEKIYVYLARDLVPCKQNLDPDEIIEVVTYPLDEVVEMISTSQITDALTILSIHRAWNYIQEN